MPTQAQLHKLHGEKRFDCKRCRSQPNIAIIAGKRNVAVQIRAAFGHTARQHAMYHERAEQNGNVKHRADACQRFSDVAGRFLNDEIFRSDNLEID